jgi:hypothetical protein
MPRFYHGWELPVVAPRRGTHVSLWRAANRAASVVAREDANASAACESPVEGRGDAREPRCLHDGRDDRDVARAVEEGRLYRASGSPSPPLVKGASLRR